MSIRRIIECGRFMTPHYLLNLVHADMCNKPYLTTEFTVKDRKTFEVNCLNSPAYFALQTTAYSSLQSSKLDFMKTTAACPNHAQKASKMVTRRVASSLKFIPSLEDFGSSSDSESLHYCFKEALAYVQGAQEKYVKSRLEDLANGKVLGVAN